jgi:hypothetical protein
MKQGENTRGTPLAGLAVKVTTGFFMIGLSNVEADRERNIQLLKERAWLDIPLVYGDKRRAIMAIEKGAPGERAFAEASRRGASSRERALAGTSATLFGFGRLDQPNAPAAPARRCAALPSPPPGS